MRGVWLDGRECPDGKVLLDAEDLSLERGLTAFETLRTYRAQAFRPGAHHARLVRSLDLLGMAPVPSAIFLADLERALAYSRSWPGEVVIRVTITGGGHRITKVVPLPEAPDRVSVALRGWAVESPIGEAKHGSRAWHLRAVATAGCEEVLWRDAEGQLLEGTWSNVFAVRDGRLLTPPADGRILSGITRGALLEAAGEVGIPVVETGALLEPAPDELYLSSSLKELVPVVELDGVAAPGAGPVGERLHRAFAALVARECP